MDIARIKNVLKKIPPGISLSALFVSVDPGTLFQSRSAVGSQDQKEILNALTEVRRVSEEQFKTLAGELQSVGISSKEQVARLITLFERSIQKQKSDMLKSCFLQAEDAFEAQINKNFLFQFDGPNTDYLQLLSVDLRKLFFKFFNQSIRTNEYNCFCIIGQEGVGKTFNSLLIAKRLTQEGYRVYYCEDVRDTNLTEAMFSEVMGSFDAHFVFIIDNCQTDLNKMERIVARISRAAGYTGKPRFIFLTRPLDAEDMEDIFGTKSPVIDLKGRYVDFAYLAGLFFKKINLSNKLNEFLASLEQRDLSKALFKYKNMAFWNEFFRSIEGSPDVKMADERDFYERANRFVRKREPYLIENKDVLEKLLPFFVNDLPIHRDYVINYLQVPETQIQKLEQAKVVSFSELHWDSKNWENDTAKFVVSKIHPTKARIVGMLFQKYERVSMDVNRVLADYADAYYENLYYIISPFYYGEIELLEELCNSDKFISVARRYLKERHLGKQLDRVIRSFSRLSSQQKEKLIDDEIISAFAGKLNDKRPYMVSRLYLFRAIFKFSPSLVYDLFKRFDVKVFIDNFNSNPEETGIASFAKFMEVFKNIYYFAGTEEEKAVVVNFVKAILDECWEQFATRFEKRDAFFTQLNWLLKRLNGMKLANHFLEKISPERIVQWIKSKDTNIVELRYVFSSARYTSYLENDGSKKKYYDYFRTALNYEDMKKILDNKRSTLYYMVINAQNEMFVNHLYRYSSESTFRQKILSGKPYLIDKVIGLLEKNFYLSNEQKIFIIDKIKATLSLKKESPPALKEII